MTSIKVFSFSPSIADRVNDLTIINDSIFIISHGSPQLLKFSTSGVLLETVDLSQPGTYFGLAVDNTHTISVPESSNLWGLGIFSLLGIFALKSQKK
ncbi:hypothetical protein CWATWH0402_6273 [Crocosphaera watsonii WH 0402]|uniref:PEP-CTERM protein-sorting domain-containing protein n=1 Tax=Crocosphaera watsonii WH 0402 TaxID=1284629 RepID=T2JZ23_CROWT|nr:hypothetical protein [Crocosphaera watsonii]CCQ70505.1 hypothetical protein CWATWH0402_6273 [Crocosphaera watsonii WH 0402]